MHCQPIGHMSEPRVATSVGRAAGHRLRTSRECSTRARAVSSEREVESERLVQLGHQCLVERTEQRSDTFDGDRAGQPGFNLVLTGEWLDPADDDANIAWVRSTFDAVAPYTSDAVYVNYLGGDETNRIRNAYGPNWDRLVALKRRWDPDNVFHLNQNIDPAG